MLNPAQRDELRQSLSDLHTLLLETDGIQDETKILLRQVARDIDRVLEDESAENEGEDLVSRWRDVVLRFEVRHPHLTHSVDQLTTALANLGISSRGENRG